jgi:hypothetical protein
MEGVTRIIGGPLTSTLLSVVGPSSFTVTANICQAMAFAIRAFGAKGYTMPLYLALLPQVIGKQREEAVKALFIQHGLRPSKKRGEGKDGKEEGKDGKEDGKEGEEDGTADGMQEGELQAAMANWCAVLRVVSPLIYGQCYSRVHPAAPYVLAVALQGIAANATFVALPPADRAFGGAGGGM